MGNMSIRAGTPFQVPGERVAKQVRQAETQRNALLQQLKEAVTTPGESVLGTLGKLAAAGKQLVLPNHIAYTIQAGDNLTSIAQKQLGPQADANQVEKYMNQILELNEDIIQNPHQLYKGDVIAVPVVPVQGQAQVVQKFLD